MPITIPNQLVGLRDAALAVQLSSKLLWWPYADLWKSINGKVSWDDNP
jgi:hypothetical protein